MSPSPGTKLGRDVVLDYLREVGIEHIFGVPGTNEVPLIDGTKAEGSRISYIPCLHENIAMGAAMGYAWVSGKPGVVELHVTPGAGHGVGNLYNAYKSHVPLVILCAQQHSDLLLQEPVLSSDLVRTAGQYAKWAYEVRTAAELPQVMQRALKEAMTPPTRPVFLSIPWDFTLAELPDEPARVTRVGSNFTGDPESIDAAAALLAGAKSPIVVAGDGVGAAGAWEELQRLAELIKAEVYNEPMSSYMNYPNDHYQWRGEVPQDQAGIQKTFAPHDVAFLCGYNAQAHVFVYDQAKGPLIPASVTQVFLHDDEWEIAKNGYGAAAVFGGIRATLPLLCEAIEAKGVDQAAAGAREAELRQGGEQRRAGLQQRADAVDSKDGSAVATGDDVAKALRALQDEMSAEMTLVDEAIWDQGSFHEFVKFDAPNSYFNAQGGSLGVSMPASIGAKLAAGDGRTIVNTVGDGTALFYPHSWWTTRKFDLPILYIVTNNREYKTLMAGRRTIMEVYRWEPEGDDSYLRLEHPHMSFVDLAKPFGIEGTLVECVAQLEGALRQGLAAVEGGQPYVVEVLVDRELPAPSELPARTGPP